MPIAYNKQTGETLFLDQSGEWIPAKIAENPQTGERVAFDGEEWKPIDAAPMQQPQTETPARQATISAAPPLTGMEVASGALRNFPASAGRLAGDIVEPFMHPVETGKAMYSLGKGILQKLIPGEQADEATADAVGQWLTERWGGVENVKRTMREDPAGFLADASMVLTGGGTAVARAPGIVGKAGQAVKAAGQAIDPIMAAGKAVGAGARLGGKAAGELLGYSTGAGPESMGQAYKAGRAGGEMGEAFKGAIRQKDSAALALDEARQALKNMRQNKQAGYVADTEKFMSNTKKIDFRPIADEFADLNRTMEYKGKRKIGSKTEKIIGEIEDVLDEWQSDDRFHDAGGLDALKQRLDDIDVPIENAQGRRAVTRIRNKVKDQIVKEIPEYADAMKRYEELHKLEKEIERALSLNDRASQDTAIRKLQSVLRNNVNTNFGFRQNLMSELMERGGAPNLEARLAGQTMTGMAPRGLKQLGPYLLGGSAVSSQSVAPLLAAPFMSPYLMGEAAYGVGAAGRLSSELMRGLGITPQRAAGGAQAFFQTGRLADELKKRK